MEGDRDHPELGVGTLRGPRYARYSLVLCHISEDCPPCIAPEPHVLLFRRPKNFDPHQAAQQPQAYEGQNKAAGAAKNGRKK